MHYYDTVFGRFFDFCDDDGSFSTVCSVEINKLLEGIILHKLELE